VGGKQETLATQGEEQDTGWVGNKRLWPHRARSRIRGGWETRDSGHTGRGAGYGVVGNKRLWPHRARSRIRGGWETRDSGHTGRGAGYGWVGNKRLWPHRARSRIRGWGWETRDSGHTGRGAGYGWVGRQETLATQGEEQDTGWVGNKRLWPHRARSRIRGGWATRDSGHTGRGAGYGVGGKQETLATQGEEQDTGWVGNKRLWPHRARSRIRGGWETRDSGHTGRGAGYGVGGKQETLATQGEGAG